MSVKVTVSWRFVSPDLGDYPTGSYVNFEVNDDHAPAAAPARREPDRVLPQGSSVVAPGLAFFLAA